VDPEWTDQQTSEQMIGTRIRTPLSRSRIGSEGAAMQEPFRFEARARIASFIIICSSHINSAACGNSGPEFLGSDHGQMGCELVMLRWMPQWLLLFFRSGHLHVGPTFLFWYVPLHHNTLLLDNLLENEDRVEAQYLGVTVAHPTSRFRLPSSGRDREYGTRVPIGHK
jgi:hypothetical protein